MAVFAQLLHNGLAAFLAAHAGVAAAHVAHAHVAVVVDDLDEFQVVGMAELPVVGIVAGGHLQAAGTEFAIHVAVGDERNFAVHHGHDELLAHEGGIAFVVGMHAHGGVAENGFGAGGGDGHGTRAIGEVVAHMPEHALGVDVIHFVIGKGGVAARAPVDDVLALVDEPFLIELHEHLAHGAGEVVVHGEGFARPVHGGAEFLDLFQNLAAVLLLPFPDALDEGFAAHVVTALAFLGEGAFHHVLRGDAGVVGAGNPQHVLALLTGMTAEYVLKGLVQGVADVQNARDVGRRNDDGIGVAGGGQIGREGLGFFPVLAPVSFHFLRFIGFGQHFKAPMVKISAVPQGGQVGAAPLRRKRLPSLSRLPISCRTGGLCVCIRHGGKT